MYSNERIVGIFFALTPTLIVRDPELVKDVLVNSVDYFSDNDAHVDKNVDVIFGRNLYFLKGTEWEQIRTQITPAFTSLKVNTLL